MSLLEKDIVKHEAFGANYWIPKLIESIQVHWRWL